MTSQQAAALIVIIMNAGALVWGAATLSTSVKGLTSTVGELKQLVTKTSDMAHSLVARVSVLEAGITGTHNHKRHTDVD